MAFVKLDTGILKSPLWMEMAQRNVFLTALLMAEPREFSAPQEQIAVDSLESTGFVVPPGWYGFCPAAGVGILRAAIVDREEGMEALRALGEPDVESRSKQFEGRRMIRVDGGYIILNYMLYRERDHDAAERMRKLRARRQVVVTPNVRNVTPNNRNGVTKSDAIPPNVTPNVRNVTPNNRNGVTKSDAVPPNVTPNVRNVTPNNRNGVTKSDAVPPNVTQADADAEEAKARRRKKQALLGQADLSAAGGETDPETDTIFPDGLSEGQYAWRVLEAVSIPSGAPLLRRAAGNAIAMLARKLDCPMPRAAVEMLAVVREAQVEGVLKWLEWFQNGGWMPFVLQAEGEP